MFGFRLGLSLRTETDKNRDRVSVGSRVRGEASDQGLMLALELGLLCG